MAVGVNTTGDNFYNCLRDQQLGSALSCMCFNVKIATLQLFEYSLTFSDEVRLIWCLRLSASSILFLVARYAGLLSSLVTLAQTPASTVLVANLGTVLRYIVIIASEAILAVRTWAIWEKKKSILVLLCVVSAAGITGAIVFLVRGAGTTTARSGQSLCVAIINEKPYSFLVPYLTVLTFEIMTISLSAARILKWREQIVPSARTPLLDVLWNDGLIYFCWIIILGVFNVLLIFRGSAGVKTGGAQLQTSIHSMLSTRIVLHLAKLPHARQARAAQTHSSLFAPTTCQLTTEHSMTRMWMSDTTVDDPYLTYNTS